MRCDLVTLVFIGWCKLAVAQSDSSGSHPHPVPTREQLVLNGPCVRDPNWEVKQKLYPLIIGETVLGAGSLMALNSVWYKDYPRTSFHFFDDSREWLQVDKCGHAVTSYYIGRIGNGLLGWCGVDAKKAAWYGGALGFVYQSGLEMLDGFSSGWGFSWSDMGANAAGSLLFIGQQLGWQQQRATLKFSWHATHFANDRPELLGSTPAERLFKDYNGQTYWLSVNIASFIKKENEFPKWLNLAFGYGAEGMIGGHFNPVANASGQLYPLYERYRQFYFSLDADLWRIKNLPRFLKVFTQTFGFIKIPFPTLELSGGRMKGYWLYF